MDDVEKEAKSTLQRIIRYVIKTSTPKQMIMGASSGWIAGFLAMRVAKTAALALGGGIIVLQIANEKGYIKINWKKLDKTIDKVADKVEEKVVGQGPTFLDKTERLIKRKLKQTDDHLNKAKNQTKTWYSGLLGDDCQLKDVHVFFVSFLAGVALGVGTS